MTIRDEYGRAGFPHMLRIKRRVFVSYHHGGDQYYYNEFSRIFGEQYEMIFDNSLERKVDSDNVDYVMRRIRENYLTGTSCTVLLVGASTWTRKFVDWELSATLGMMHGLLALQLPTLPIFNNSVRVPDRLDDNIVSGYAVWKMWDYLVANPLILPNWIEEANNKNKLLIRNTRVQRTRNS